MTKSWGKSSTKERTNKEGAVAQVFSEEFLPFLESASLTVVDDGSRASLE
jgi:hypothetical protein